MRKIIIFNGPPKIGKDTTADHFAAYMNDIGIETTIMAFKDKLYEIVKAIYGLSDKRVAFLERQENKNVPMKEFGGRSFRDIMIFTSEKVIKPSFGKDYFGRAAADKASTYFNAAYEVVLFSDGGFVEEAIPVINACDDMLVVRLHPVGGAKLNPDGTFMGDSRKYLPDSDYYCTMDITNTMDETYFQIINNNVSNWLFGIK